MSGAVRSVSHVNTQNTSGLDKLPPRLTVQQAADALGVCGKTIRRHIADGKLTAYRIGRRMIRVDRDSLLALQRPMGAMA